MKDEIMQRLIDSVIKMDIKQSEQAARDALDEGIDAYEAIMEGLAKGMEKVGELYDTGEYFVPEMICCADTMYAGMEILKPHIKKSDDGVKKKVVIGVVEGDTHDIGKNLVVMMLESADFEVYDLGKNVPLKMFGDKAIEVGADVIGMSTLMTTTRDGMKTVIDDVRNRIDSSMPVVIGGAAVNKAFAQQIGADAYSKNAVEAISIVQRLVAGKE
jgi:dimethylamine corrinoid protein